ncbi:MAG: 50S ribosomal protein L1 [Bacteroides sp.]|nr:MAG: 50S ribosomal protein L1 [Bacteroides sp.]
MIKITKKRKDILSIIDHNKTYDVKSAVELIYKIKKVNFNASIDLHLRLNVDIKKSINNIRGSISIPHGNGKKNKILALCDENEIDLCLKSGADYAGLEDYIFKIENKWFDFDNIVISSKNFSKISKLGPLLGPKGLMPTIKSGNITDDLQKEIMKIKKGKIYLKMDKGGIIHITIGKTNFSIDQICENTIYSIKQISSMFSNYIKKNDFYKSIFLVSTMGASVKIDSKNIL